MTLEVLISCMYQEDSTLVDTSGITTDVLIINQCDQNKTQEWCTVNQHIRMISTTDRGLSNSRNMAITNAQGDICLLCDDDEFFFLNYESTITKGFERLPEADVIIFNIENHPCSLKKSEHRLRYMELLRVCSWQIAFRREAVCRAGVLFDPLMGAGSGNGAQEESMFLMNCFRVGLKIYYVPDTIGRVDHGNSTWFQGYDRTFFYQRGGATRQLLGLPLSLLYACYYAVTKRKMYCHECTFRDALYSSIQGCLDNPIHRQRISKGRRRY